MTKEEDVLEVYELGFHLIPTIREEEVGKEFENINKVLNKFKAEIISSEAPKRARLSYTMVKKTQSGNEKYDHAFFAWIKFVTSTENISKIKEIVDENERILRYILIKTERESSKTKTASKEEVSEDESVDEAKNEVLGQEKVAIKTEDIDEALDRSIDELTKE